MKKRIWILLMALVMIVSLVGCGGGGGGKDPTGTYALLKMEEGGEEITAKDMAEIFGGEIGVTLEITKDKKFKLDMGVLGDEGEEVISGTWETKGDSLVLSAAGDEMTVKYDEKTVTLDVEGFLLVFEKE